MQQRVVSDKGREETAETAEQTPPATRKRRRRGPIGLNGFIHWDREEQRKAFFAWLPKALHDAPGIDWMQLSPRILGYCVRTLSNTPDSAVFAVTAASLMGALEFASMWTHFKNVTRLIRDF